MERDDTQSFEVPPTEPEAGPVAYEVVERRYFGLPPSSLLAALAALLLVLALVSFAALGVIAGVLFLIAGLLFGGLYVEQSRHRRDTPLDRSTAFALDRARGLAGYAGATLRAWSGAGRRVSALRLEAARLRRERSQLQYALGRAVHEGDAQAGELIADRLREVDALLDALGREVAKTLARTRRHTSRERLAVASTQIRRPQH